MINPSIHSHGSKFSDGEPLYLDTTNNRLGINTTSPSHALNVEVSASDDGIVLHKAGSSNDIFKVSMDGTADQGELFLYDGGVIECAIRCNANVSYINTGANFGIGNTTPGSILEIQGDGGNDKQLRLASGSSSTYWDIGRNYQTGHFEITEDSGDTYFLIDKDNGNVGLGVAAPASPLHVEGAIRVKRVGVDAHGTIDLEGNLRLAAHSGYNITFHSDQTNVGGTEIVRFRSNGKVGIGKTVPASELAIANSTSATAIELYETWTDDSNYERGILKFDSGYFVVGTDDLGTGTASGLKFETDSSLRVAIHATTGLMTAYGGIKIQQSTPQLELYDSSSSNSGVLKVDNLDMIIANGGDDGDLIFQCDAGNGTLANYFWLDGGDATHDGSATTMLSTKWPDNSRIAFGDGNDLLIYHNGNNSHIQEQGDGDLYFEVGSSLYMRDPVSGNMMFGAKTGSGKIVELWGGGTKRFATNSTGVTASGTLTVGADTDGHDVKFFGNTSGAYMLWDESTDDLILGGDSKLGIGTTSPAALLDIADSQTLSGSTMDATVQTTATLTATSTQTGGYKIQDYFNLTGTGGSFTNTAHQQVMTTVSSTGTGTYLKNHMSRVHTSGSGQIHTVAHYNTHTELGGNGTITNWIGYAVADGIMSSFENSGHTITNTYGLYIGDLTHGTQTNTPYGVYQASTDMINHFGGNVGIGTTSPNAMLHVSHATAPTFRLSRTGTGQIWHQSIDSSGRFLMLEAASEGGTQYTRLSIDDDGKVGINTGTPTANLTIADGTTATALELYETYTDASNYERATLKFDSNYLVLDTEDLGTGAASGLKLQTDGNTRLTITAAGATTFAAGATFNGDVIMGGNHQAHADGGRIRLGDSLDLELYHDGTNSMITNNTTGDLKITQGADNGDIVFLNDNGSGGTTEYLVINGDSEVNNFVKSSLHNDNAYAYFGNSHDLQIYHDGTDSYISNTQNEGNLIIQNNANDHDIVFKCDDGSNGIEEYFRLDGGVSSGYPRTIFPDDSTLNFGNDMDLRITHMAGASYILNTQATDLYIRQDGADKDIIFQADDGTGSDVATYFFLDGSYTGIGIEGQTYTPSTVFPDHSLLALGTHRDLKLWYNNVRGRIAYTGGNEFQISAINDLALGFNDSDGVYGETAIICTKNGAVKFRHDNSQKFETLTDGVKVTGAMALTETTTPTATADVGKVYTKSDNKLYFQDGGGTEHEIAFA